MIKDEKYILVDSEESLANLLADLELYDMAAVDTEADSMYHYTARLCLIQITIGNCITDKKPPANHGRLKY